MQELAHIVATFRPLIARLFAERVVAGLLSVLGMLALVLAAVGLYSVLAYAVSERTSSESAWRWARRGAQYWVWY